MNDLQALIDRQLGFYSRINYDNILLRLNVRSEDSFYGLQNFNDGTALEQDPPIFACRFAETAGYEHILALANEDGRVAIQDTSKVIPNTTVQSYQCHNNAVFDLAWTPHSMSFLTVSGDHTACLWAAEAAGPRRVLVFPGHSRSVKTAAFRGDGRVFATGARDGHVLLWDARCGARPEARLAACHAAFAPKTPGSHSKRRPPPRATSITGLAFRDDATLLSCGECDGNIKAWDLRKNYSAYTREPLPKHSVPYCGSSTRNGYTSLVVDAAGVRLYASCMDSVVYCFNVATYAPLPERRYVGHESGTFYIKTCLSPDGRYLVSGSSDKLAYVWNVRSAAPAARLAGHRAEVTCAAWRAGPGAALVTCSDDARHKIWRVGREELGPDERAELKGCAEPVPRHATLPVRGGGAERTPRRRRCDTPARTPGAAKRPRLEAPARSKRCLAAAWGAAAWGAAAAAGDEPPAKRLAPEPPSAAAGPRSSPRKRRRSDDAWTYEPRAGSSFFSPTKNYEKPACKTLSVTPPERAARRLVSLTTPTKDLPDFVRDGEAPHLRLMSPQRRKPETTDWLTRLVRERRARAGPGPAAAAPAAPASPASPASPAAAPARRNSATIDKTPKATKHKPLLKYFSVSAK